MSAESVTVKEGSWLLQAPQSLQIQPSSTFEGVTLRGWYLMWWFKHLRSLWLTATACVYVCVCFSVWFKHQFSRWLLRYCHQWSYSCHKTTLSQGDTVVTGHWCRTWWLLWPPPRVESLACGRHCAECLPHNRQGSGVSWCFHLHRINQEAEALKSGSHVAISEWQGWDLHPGLSDVGLHAVTTSQYDLIQL